MCSVGTLRIIINIYIPWDTPYYLVTANYWWKWIPTEFYIWHFQVCWDNGSSFLTRCLALRVAYASGHSSIFILCTLYFLFQLAFAFFNSEVWGFAEWPGPWMGSRLYSPEMRRGVWPAFWFCLLISNRHLSTFLCRIVLCSWNVEWNSQHTRR